MSPLRRRGGTLRPSRPDSSVSMPHSRQTCTERTRLSSAAGGEAILVDLGDRTVAVRLRSDRRARRLTLRVPVSSAPPVLTVPARVGRAAVEAFLGSHRAWLAEKLSGRPEAVPFAPGAIVPLRGTDHEIVHDAGLRGTVVPRDGGLEAPRLVVGGLGPHLPRRLRDWLAAEARRDLRAAVDRHAAALGMRPKAIRVRDTVSRWGSCSSAGVLSFSWRLVLAPPEILDYLAAHEVAHLVHMDHSPAYWSVVARLFPEHRAARDWLKREGGRLHAIGSVVS